LSGTFAGRQDSYGVHAGGYMLRSFNMFHISRVLQHLGATKTNWTLAMVPYR
jgi:hypothetical protein